MHLDLTHEESRFLAHQLALQLEHVTTELVHTDKREMQRDLAADERHLKEILAKLDAADRT